MRYLILIVTLFLTSCGYYRSYSFYMSTLEYSNSSISDGWRVDSPEGNRWRTDYSDSTPYRQYIPKYFSKKDMSSLNWSSKFNFFYAEYVGNLQAPLALWVRVQGVVEVWKDMSSGFFGPAPEKVKRNSLYCRKHKGVGIEITTNAVDMDFTTKEVFFLKNNQKVYGKIALLHKDFLSPTTSYYRHGVYNLSDPEVIATMQPDAIKPFPYPSFGFEFPLSCRDLENAVLVIGGFSYKGRPIPPLKVRMNYYDFSTVPAFGDPPMAGEE